jgi:hypothetical protein
MELEEFDSDMEEFGDPNGDGEFDTFESDTDDTDTDMEEFDSDMSEEEEPSDIVLRNLDSCLDGHDTMWVGNHPNAPQGPARVIVLGKTGAGKTNSVLSSLDFIKYDQLWIYARMKDEAKYRTLERKHKGKDWFFLSDDLGDLPDVNDIPRDLQTVIVIDDFGGEKKDIKAVEDLFRMSRKTNTSVYWIAHDFFNTAPLSLRKQASHFYLFPPHNAFELGKLFTRLAPPGMSKKGWLALFDELISKLENGQNFLYIESTRSGSRDFRVGFNHPIPQCFFAIK